MIKDNKLCVLSTCLDNLPNSSLMLYVSNEAGTEIYMLTMKGSTKYNNIMNNPHVSLLVDTRTKPGAESSEINALTAYGKACILTDKDAEMGIKETLVKINPGLAVIAESPDSCVVKVEIESFLMLEGVNESRFDRI